MNSSTKSIFPLFETVRVQKGFIQNSAYHKKRFQWSCKKFFGEYPQFDLFGDMHVPTHFGKGVVKLRIAYNLKGKEYHFEAYSKKPVQTLRIVKDDTIDYDLKFEERGDLERLNGQRMECDDVLIIKKGWVTDTSYGNIILWDGRHWCTPNTCLLRGTQRAELLDKGILREAAIRLSDLREFKGFQVINAMQPFENDRVLPMQNIRDRDKP